ncbi:MAG: potassium channel family protein [Prolixibacteraceae bacterium]|nr:potassium channel family protein [Prolixibacteraceae bacterium]
MVRCIAFVGHCNKRGCCCFGKCPFIKCIVWQCFSSIPRSIYWAIVTLTTVGYGDITPQTVMGQALASVIMIIGYANMTIRMLAHSS